MSFKKVLLTGFVAVLIGLLSATSVTAAENADGIGIIESQKLLYQHPRFESVVKQIADTNRQKERVAYNAADKEKNHEKKARILQDLNDEMRQEEARLMEPILRDCYEAVVRVANARNMTIVLEKDAAFFGGTNITEEVVSQLKKTALGAK